MAFITINGVNVPTPTDFQVGIQDIANTQRNANGQMIIERIAVKKTLSISYAYLSASDLSTVLQAVSPVTFDVTYLDPITNSNVTSSFYCGDRSLGMIDFINSIPRYQNVKFDLIER